MEEAYCVKCRAKTEIKDLKEIIMKNGRPAVRGECLKCGSAVFRIGRLGPPISTKADIAKIVSEFDEWLNSEDGIQRRQTIANEKTEVKELMRKLSSMDKTSQEFTDLVLYGLLPYSKTKMAKRVSIFPVFKNIKAWFKKYNYSDKDWNRIANMIFTLAKNFEGDPENLKQYIKEFTSNKTHSRRLQCSSISPILFCINDSFPLINKPITDTYDDFAGVHGWDEDDYISGDLDYYVDDIPRCEKLMDFIGRDRLRNFEVFDLFCYWYRGKLQEQYTEPSWNETYTSILNDMEFYRAVSCSLLQYKNDRQTLYNKVNKFDKYNADDVCPFTFMTWLHKFGINSWYAKIDILELEKLVEFLGVSMDIPSGGTMNHFNINTTFFKKKYKRGETDIEELWNAFENALKYADDDSELNRKKFIQSFTSAYNLPGVKDKLTVVLFWCRPEKFLPLDKFTRDVLYKDWKINIPDKIDGESYLNIIREISSKLPRGEIDSFLKLLWLALVREYDDEEGEDDEPTGDEIGPEPSTDVKLENENKSYSIVSIVEDGCFVDKADLEGIMNAWRERKNLILQGPPGTGKTWLAGRLAKALTGKDDGDVRAIQSIQFHPGTSYEDFVRGWRPDGKGSLGLTDGPFMKMIDYAKDNPGEIVVLIIEEINRGNPANIFGEMLTLLEADKRTQKHALQLSYPKDDIERVYVPENIYLIGTMNTADRSATRMDLALRRRFDFVDIEPAFNEKWTKWCRSHGVDGRVLSDIKRNFENLNRTIEGDMQLGRQFRIGHSYVTPDKQIEPGRQKEWLDQRIRYGVGPLLDEYWTEDPKKASEQKELLKKIGD